MTAIKGLNNESHESSRRKYVATNGCASGTPPGCGGIRDGVSGGVALRAQPPAAVAMDPFGVNSGISLRETGVQAGRLRYERNIGVNSGVSLRETSVQAGRLRYERNFGVKGGVSLRETGRRDVCKIFACDKDLDD